MLIVEDGTGLPDAESAVSLAEFDAYCEKRGYADLIDKEEGEKEAAARNATEYADTYRRFKGRTISGDQALQFPREGLSDWSGHPVLGLPRKFKEAVCFLMVQVLNDEPLYEVLDREISSESVGPISTSYVAGANRHREFTAVDRLLCQWVRDDASPRPAPGFTPPEAPPTFTLGMQDTPPKFGGSEY